MVSFFYLGFKVACQFGLQVLKKKHHLYERTESLISGVSQIFFLLLVLFQQLPSRIKIYHQYLIDNVLCLICLYLYLFQAETEKTIPYL